MKKALTEIYSKHTKRPYDELYNYMERDKFWLPYKSPNILVRK